MKKILFITNGNINCPSSRVRVFQYLKYLDYKNIKKRVIIPFQCRNSKLSNYLMEIRFMRSLIYSINWAYIIFLCNFYNIIFIQKFIFTEKKLDRIKKLNNYIIYDFDDAIYTHHPSKKDNPNQRRRLVNMLKAAHLIIVSNKYLKDYAKKFNINVEIIPTVVDCKDYTLKGYNQKKDKIILGYACSPENLYYLKGIHKPLKIITKKYPNVYLKVVTSAPFRMKGVRIINQEFSLVNHIKTLQSFDIGIQPLNDDKWTRSKSGYKAIECMSVGVPVVSSPIGINKLIIKNGVNGFLVKNKDEWIDKLSQLIEDSNLIKRLGINARKTIVQDYSLRSNISLFNNILKNI